MDGTTAKEGDREMRELTKTELACVSGGAVVDNLFGISQIGRGLTAFSAAGALAGSFYAGYELGTWIYRKWVLR